MGSNTLTAETQRTQRWRREFQISLSQPAGRRWFALRAQADRMSALRRFALRAQADRMSALRRFALRAQADRMSALRRFALRAQADRDVRAPKATRVPRSGARSSIADTARAARWCERVVRLPHQSVS